MPAMVVIAPWSWTSLHWRTSSAAAAVTPLNARTSDAGYTQRPRRTTDRSSTIATAAPASAYSGETASQSTDGVRMVGTSRAWASSEAITGLPAPGHSFCRSRVARLAGRNGGLLVVAPPLHAADHTADRRLDPVDDRLRVDAEKEAEREQRHHRRELAHLRSDSVAFSPLGTPVNARW